MKDIKESVLYIFISLIIVSGLLLFVFFVPPEIGKLVLLIMLGLFILSSFIFFLCLLNYIFKHAKCNPLGKYIPM